MRMAPGVIARPGVRVMCEGGPGVIARRGVLVLTSVAAGWLAAGLTDLLWLLPAVPAVVWTATRTELPRRSARRPVEPLEPVDRDWQTFQRRHEALRATEAGPAVLEVLAATPQEDRTERWVCDWERWRAAHYGPRLTAEEVALVVRIERDGYTRADGLELVERRRAALGTL